MYRVWSDLAANFMYEAFADLDAAVRKAEETASWHYFHPVRVVDVSKGADGPDVYVIWPASDRLSARTLVNESGV